MTETMKRMRERAQSRVGGKIEGHGELDMSLTELPRGDKT
jgi:hypothetical protein